MNPNDIFRKAILPKIIMAVFIIIAYEILRLFPIMDKPILHYAVQSWLHLAKNLILIGICIGLFPSLLDLIVAAVASNFKEKYQSWPDAKKKSLSSFVYNCLTVILVLISYSIISSDLSLFITNSTIDTLVRVTILLVGILFVYKGYVELKVLLASSDDESIQQ